MRVTAEVPDQQLRDILTNAVEQGIAYWVREEGYIVERIRRAPSGDVAAITLRMPPREDGAPSAPALMRNTVKVADLAVGLSKHGARFPHILSAVLGGQTDALIDDAVFQLACFGDIVFG